MSSKPNAQTKAKRNPTAAVTRLQDWMTRLLPLIHALNFLVLAAATVFSACQARSIATQTSLLATQVASEVAKPSIKANAIYRITQLSQVDEVKQQMLDQFFRQMEQLKEAYPATPSSELMLEALPISRQLPAGPLAVTVTAFNEGSVPATRLTVEVAWTQPLLEYQVRALSPSTLVRGGPGQSSITIEIARVSPEERIELQPIFATPEGMLDTITLDIDRESALAIPPATPQALAAEPLTMPTFSIAHPDQADPFKTISITITSDQTAAQTIQTLPGELIDTIPPEFYEYFDLQRFLYPALGEDFFLPP